MEPHKRAEIVDMFRGDLPVSAIAEEMEVSPSTIYRVLNEEGLAARSAKQTALDLLPPETVDAIARAYAVEGRPASTIIRAHDISYNFLYMVLAERNINYKEFSDAEKNTKQERLDRAVQLYQDGILLYTIQAETGIHQPQLHAELRVLEIPLRNKSER